MILVTGDLHCPLDIHKLGSKNFDSSALTKDDYLIVCGDTGLVWHNRDKEDNYWQKWLEAKPWTTLFVDGNHENHDKLDSYPVSDWHGGKVHFLKPSVIHLMRGNVYDIDGLSFFTMGGAMSQDKHLRKEGKTWWAREMPSPEEYETAISNLKEHNFKVDYIITHCAPSIEACNLIRYVKSDELMQFFNNIERNTRFKHWYFGHYHEDVQLGPNFTCCYNAIRLISR